MTARPPFDGYVLCGGASRRMGRDKALVPVGGVAMARRAADALVDAGAGSVAAVGGDRDALVRLGLSWVRDRWPGAGPVGGIITALESDHGAAVAVVVSCDLVDPDPRAVAAVVAARARHDVDVAVPVVEGRHQWLHAAWHRRAAATLAARFEAGDRSVTAACRALRMGEVEDLPAAALRDADRPGDLPTRSPGASSPSIGPVQVPAIDVSTLRDELEGGAPLIDVRQPDEYEEVRAPGADLIPLGEVPDRVGEVPTDSTVYVICRSGGRSAKAVEFLREQGIDAVNVSGGTLAWVEAGHPVESGA